MPGNLSPFHISAVARSLSWSVESLLAELSMGELEPEFRYKYEEQNNLNREVFTLLPTAMRLGHLTPTAQQAILRRVVLRDHKALTQFFVAIIRAPACTSHVEELHCHLDLGQHTTAENFCNDITLLSDLSHLDHCSISLDILISIKDHMLKEVDDQLPYRPALDVRFRQAIFLSLLGHLRNLKTLRMTVHGRAHETLSWLNRELQFHYPRQLTETVPCKDVCRSPTKITLCAADDYDPSAPWHPLVLWPLIDLPEVQDLEIDNNTNGQNGLDTSSLSADDSSNDENSEENNDIYASLVYLSALRIKNYLPYPVALQRIFSSFKTLRTLEICGSVPTHGSPDARTAAASEVNLDTFLQIPAVAKTLKYLSIDEGSPTPYSAKVLFGPGERLSPRCLEGLTELRVLYIPSFALFGGMEGAVDVETGASENSTAVEEEGQLSVGLVGAQEHAAVYLPPKLERLEVVEEPHSGAGEMVSERPKGTQSIGRVVELMRSVAMSCAHGAYPALKHVVLWCRGGGCDWCPLVQEEVEAVFQKAGVEFKQQKYDPWPKEKVGGWRLLGESLGQRTK